MSDKRLKSMERLGSLRHGQVLGSRTLGEMSVVSRSSAMVRGFRYPVSVQAVAQSSSLLILHEEFYFVVDALDGARPSLLFPLQLVKSLAVSVESENNVDAFDDVQVLRLLTTQLDKRSPIGVCRRGLESIDGEESELCVYQVFDRNQGVVELEKAMNRLLDFALLLWERARKPANAPVRNLAKSVESHRY